MTILAATVGLIMVLGVLWDAFETIVLPRRVTRRLRLTTFFFRITWSVWSRLARLILPSQRRERFLAYFGPLSLILLVGVWAISLVVAFGLLHWGFDAELRAPEDPAGFGAYLYLSGTTFFTLGLGDVTPVTPAGRFLTVAEVGTGFAFLALVIGYLPVLYQAFSRREVNISLLDARAGSPPSAGELLRRAGQDADKQALGELLKDWETWSAELLETHLSYPVLAFYRSQHDRLSWLAALTTVLDACALVSISDAPGSTHLAAQLTFNLARDTVAVLCQTFRRRPTAPDQDRLPPADLARLRDLLAPAGLRLRDDAAALEHLAELRALYEPYVHAIARHLRLSLPAWLPAERLPDEWRRGVWAPTHTPASKNGAGRAVHKARGHARRRT